ncbi:hypothetical protein HYW58_03165 [Candidatus Kaiserbacteria bacterium]|nr:hypothetical protein [Candidatus Kaiserbacteria bacterium]
MLESLTSLSDGFSILFVTAPVWLPIFLFFVFKMVWMMYVQTKTFLEIPTTLFEVRIPREIAKSPLAMENALNAFFHTGEPATLGEKYYIGATRPQFSLEIVSFEGEIRFFIRSRTRIKDIIQAQIYSQYPEVEIYEVEDYMSRFVFDLSKMNLFGVELKLQKPDPYPIKTYVDFGLDKDPKEEFKVDPLSGIIEFFSSFGKGEYGLLQIIIRSHQSEKRKPGTLFQTEDWRDEAKRETADIIDSLKTETDGFTVYRPPTPQEKDLLESLGRNVAKKPFDTGIRALYIADKEYYNSARHNGFPTMFRQFESHTLNGFKPVFPTMFPRKRKDPFGMKKRMNQRILFNAYRLRSFFIPPYKRPYFVLSAEELATVFHFPGAATQAPTLGRIPSTKGGAPPNLPI